MTPRAGQHPLRREDARLLRGRARFVDNVHLPRMVHGAFVRSPFAHAEIVAVDAARALAAGALAVFTARDLPFNNQRWIVRYWHPSIRNGLPKFFAVDHVRFVGEPVAFVVATDRYRAEDLAQLVDVEYRPLPAIADVESAMAAGAIQLHPQWSGNVAAGFEHRKGEAGRRCRCPPTAAGAGSGSFGKRRCRSRRAVPSPISMQRGDR